jgi:hypothetical protein
VRTMLGVVAVAVLLALLAAPAASPAPTNHNPIRISDRRGDVRYLGAPDIREVTLFNSTKGMIQFDVAIANRRGLDIPDDDVIAIYLDTDRDASNGPYGGFEYTIQAVGLEDLFVARWTERGMCPPLRSSRTIGTAAASCTSRSAVPASAASAGSGSGWRQRCFPRRRISSTGHPTGALSPTRFRPRTSPAQMPSSSRSTLAQGIASALRESLSSSAHANDSGLRASAVVPPWRTEQFAAPTVAAVPTSCPEPPAASAS